MKNTNKNNKILFRRELAEWFKATSLKLVLVNTNIRSNRIFSVLYGLEPGWLGASFGLRISYVRIIMTRCN
jgi:hypothetical protein